MKMYGAASRAAWDFSQMEELWTRFSPLSPFGKDEKEARRVLADPAAIEALLDGTDAVLGLFRSLEGEAATLDRISWHLRRLPRLPLRPPEKGGAFDLVELFQVKKFLSNYRSLVGLIPESCSARFGLRFESSGLASALELGGSDAETFFVADAYDERLRELRKRITSVDAEIAGRRNAAARAAATKHGLDFAGRDFLVVGHAAALEADLDRSLFSVEAYDDSSFLVRLQPGREELELAAQRDALVEAERGVEEAVLSRLSTLVVAELPTLARYVEAACAFDLAKARAELARDLGLVRPRLAAAGSPLVLEQGRYLPCAWECEALGLRYVPLDFSLSEGAAVIFGSNMGGKTVALESLVFMQILAQAGFHVPAASFSSPVYPLIHYVGGQKGGRDEGEGRAGLGVGVQGHGGKRGGRTAASGLEGLSGFGFEIRSFVEAWEGSTEGALIVFDEFARTTSSHEAEAILSAVIEALVSRPRTRSLFSTHFRGVERLAGVRYLRVKGLDRDAAKAAIGAGDAGCARGSGGADGAGGRDASLQDRIRRINGMMEYGLVDDLGPGPEGSDAVAIASLLGLDPCIVARADGIFARQKEGMEQP